MNSTEIAADGYFRFQCPNPDCGQRLKARSVDVGKTAHCRKCGRQMPIPAPSRTPETDAPSLGTGLPKSVRRSEPTAQASGTFNDEPKAALPRKPHVDRAVMWTGLTAVNSTFLLLFGITGLSPLAEAQPYRFVVCLLVAALVGGYFATALADEAKLSKCLRAAVYGSILQFVMTANVLALHEALEGTRATHRSDLTNVYVEAMQGIFTSWRAIALGFAGFSVFLVGGLLERGSMAIARTVSVPEHWTYKTANGQRIEARGPWRHPVFARLWRLNGWVFILTCWLPLLMEEPGVNKVFHSGAWLVLGLLCRLLAKKRTAHSAHQAFRESANPPVIYLRSFRDDGRKVREGAWHFYTHSIFAPLTGTVEERLARIMCRFGPFVAIGKPGEEIPEMGAARMYVGDDDWQIVVSDLLRRPDALAVLQAGETQGLRWELSRIGSDLKPDQVHRLSPIRFVEWWPR